MQHTSPCLWVPNVSSYKQHLIRSLRDCYLSLVSLVAPHSLVECKHTHANAVMQTLEVKNKSCFEFEGGHLYWCKRLRSRCRCLQLTMIWDHLPRPCCWGCFHSHKAIHTQEDLTHLVLDRHHLHWLVELESIAFSKLLLCPSSCTVVELLMLSYPFDVPPRHPILWRRVDWLWRKNVQRNFNHKGSLSFSCWAQILPSR